MKELLIVPAIALVFLTIASQLTETAESTGEKVVAYASDMNDAMDCAIHARPLSECSPELFETEFTSDIENYEQQLIEIQAELEAALEDLEAAQQEAEESAN